MQTLLTKLRSLTTQAITGLCLAATVAVASFGMPFTLPSAIAAPVTQPTLAAFFNFDQADQKAKSDLDQTVGAGTSNQLEGAVQQAAGTAQRQFGDLKAQAEGTARQLDGRAKQDVGRVEGAAEDIGNSLKTAAENVSDTVKNLVN